MAESNVVVATFADESRTYQAFSEIKRVAARGEVKIVGLTIVHRTLEGRFEVRDAAMRVYGGSIAGGLIGSLVGELEEKDPNVVRQIVRRLGGELLRRPTDDVEADIAAAKAAHGSAARAAEQVFDDHRASRRQSDDR